MNSIFRRTIGLLSAFSATAAWVQAHPGHDGHENGGFTWDFSHLATHPLATLGCVALLAALVWAGWSHLRAHRGNAVQSLRKSSDK